MLEHSRDYFEYLFRFDDTRHAKPAIQKKQGYDRIGKEFKAFPSLDIFYKIDHFKASHLSKLKEEMKALYYYKGNQDVVI